MFYYYWVFSHWKVGFCGGRWIEEYFSLRGHCKKEFETHWTVLPVLVAFPDFLNVIRGFSFLVLSFLWQITRNLTIRPKVQSLEHILIQVVLDVFLFRLAFPCLYSFIGDDLTFFSILFRGSGMHRLDVSDLMLYLVCFLCCHYLLLFHHNH